jgi:S1-C subfamily serine protease
MRAATDRPASGLVLTNNHVIENSTKITAAVTTTGKTYPATVIGYDETADVALIRLQGATGRKGSRSRSTPQQTTSTVHLTAGLPH